MDIESLLVGIILGIFMGVGIAFMMLKMREDQLSSRYESSINEKLTSLASTALINNNTQFLSLANEKLNTVMTRAEGQISQTKTEIQGIVNPLKDKLADYEKLVRDLEASRQNAYGSLTEKITALTQSEQELEKITNNLTTALRNPQVRGRWGETTLKKLVELAGMVQYCDFEVQVTMTVHDDTKRPDMLVKLPSERLIIVDSKVPLNAYIDSLGANNDIERKELLSKHATSIRAHLRTLSSKAYWQQFKESPEFVVMFIPGETFLYAALEVDKELIEDGIRQNVIISTPTTLISLLKAVSKGWSEKTMEQNALHISNLGRELYERLIKMTEHLSDIGKKINSTVNSYNSLVGSYESRVLVSARKFNELGITQEGDLEEIHHLDTVTRELSKQDD